MKYFIITIDTEADNQWAKDSVLTTKNSHYIDRFQLLCEKYKFFPVYLTDYSMVSDSFYCSYMKEKIQDELCEIGMHLHAWDTPPYHSIDTSNSKPYLIEYPKGVMEEKVRIITDKLEDTFQRKMKSHRAGRWAMNMQYAEILVKNGYKVDCSVTPGVNWSNQKGSNIGGSDYSKAIDIPYYFDAENKLLEVPMTIKKMRYVNRMSSFSVRNVAKVTRDALIGKNLWLRPSVCTEKEMYRLLDSVAASNTNYVEFMMHSSEFMPGGSPYYTSEKEIDGLFLVLEHLFEKISESYSGITLSNFANLINGEMK